MNSTHLSQSERYQIYALMKAGQALSDIAKILRRHRSTIYREISRNSGLRGYRPRQAEELTRQRSEHSRNSLKITPEIWRAVDELLNQQPSPEQISAKLEVSHEVICSIFMLNAL